MSKKRKRAREVNPERATEVDDANGASASTGGDGRGGGEAPKPTTTRPQRQQQQRDPKAKSSHSVLPLVLAAAALLLLASLLFPSSTTAARTRSLALFPFRLALSLPRVFVRALRGTIRTLVVSPRWWVASLEVLVFASFHSRSVLCTLLLTHPICWFLSSYASAWAGILGSLATVVVFFCVAVFLIEGDGGFSAREEAEGRDKVERHLWTATRASLATPLAWGIVAAATSGRGVLAKGAGVAVAGWMWRRYVFSSTPSSDASDEGGKRRDPKPPPGFSSWEQWRDERRRWRGAGAGAAASTTTSHLPGVAPEGSTGEIRRVLSSRSYYEVLGVARAGEVDDGEVRRRWRDVVRRVHPDRASENSASASEEAFRLATEAYEALRDEGSRLRYERALFG